MLRTVGITNLRKQLKDYIHKAVSTLDIYQIGEGSEAAVLTSPAVIKQLQNRHYVNTWVRNQFTALKLSKYLILTNGVETKNLPLDAILALSNLFQLVQELLDILSRPNLKENAFTWDVSEFIEAAVTGKSLTSHNKFDNVYGVITKLFNPVYFEDMEFTTLLGFFYQVSNLASEDKFKEENENFLKDVKREGLESKVQTFHINEGYYLQQNDMTSEQLQYVSEIVAELAALCIDVIDYQRLSPANSQIPDRIFLRFDTILKWYAKYIGECPNNLGYDPDMEALKQRWGQ